MRLGAEVADSISKPDIKKLPEGSYNYLSKSPPAHGLNPGKLLFPSFDDHDNLSYFSIKKLILKGYDMYQINISSSTLGNEPIKAYRPGSEERVKLKSELEKQYNQTIEIPLIIGGKQIFSGRTAEVVCPHDHQHVLAVYHQAGPKEANMAIDAALEAKKQWAAKEWSQRADIFLKMADLISSDYGRVLNAATMLGQSKSIHQAEIEATGELADFMRFNLSSADDIYSKQPLMAPNVLNRINYRPLEGFIFAISPFNFTAIAGNLPCAPAIMGNTVVWKPSSGSVLSNYYLMQLFADAGLPDGVINFIPGSGTLISEVVLDHPELAGVHFTGSAEVFQSIWQETALRIGRYKNYPRIVGETGGKDYVFMHHSADIDETATAVIRAGYEYQGQKCSACSRVYVPRSRWPALKSKLLALIQTISMGDVMDFSNFMNAIIDQKSFTKIMGYIEKVHTSPDAEIIAGGRGDDSKGYFIEPTLIQAFDPHFITMEEEIFGPVVTIFVYEDDQYHATLELCDKTSPYGLTGAIFAKDRAAISQAEEILRHSAGNFYINDKPSGALVGQQPFGGSRASGTNDKAGSYLNLVRWITAQSIKENFAPPRDYRYPFMLEA